MRWLFVMLGLILLIAVGCVEPPVTSFETVPTPSATTPILPGSPTAESPTSKPVTVSKPVRAAKPTASKSSSAKAPVLIVTPKPVLTGRVTSFDAAGRFVVLNFPVSHLPALEQRLDVLRQGVKVGELKVTGPQRDDHIVADLTSGEARAGDEARER